MSAPRTPGNHDRTILKGGAGKEVAVEGSLCYRAGMTYEPREIIEYLLPFVVTAGAYSAQIQSRVGVHDAKDGDTIFHHALSDADLSIQGFLEVALLARFPDLCYFSEEQESSLNKKYFTASSPIEVLLDPVDGTRPYIDGQAYYQIIVTLHDEREIVGSICYMPQRDICLVATKGRGAFCLTREDISHKRPGLRWRVSNSEGPVEVFNSPELVAQLSPHLPTKDLAVAYVKEPGRYYATDILEGKARAVVHRTCQAIDGGSLAFIAAEGGAVVTDFSGQAIRSFRSVASRVLDGVIVAVSPEVHARILEIVR
jgi:myo-inositol-1(or 4)-monophosphatase